MIETEDFEVIDLGEQERWVYDIEVEDNHNFFANDICIHNSNYVSVERLMIKKFGEDYEDEQTIERLIEFTLNFVNKISVPLVNGVLKDSYSYMHNAYMSEKLITDTEIVADRLISIAPKIK